MRSVPLAVVLCAFLMGDCAWQPAEVSTTGVPTAVSSTEGSSNETAKPERSFDVELEGACLGDSEVVDVPVHIRVVHPEILAIDAVGSLSIVHEPGVVVEGADLGRGMTRTQAGEPREPRRAIPKDETAYVETPVTEATAANLSDSVVRLRLRRTGPTWGKKVMVSVVLPGAGRVLAEVKPCRASDARTIAIESTGRLAVEVQSQKPEIGTQAIAVTWTITFTTDTGGTRPVRYASVKVWDDDVASFDDEMWSGTSDANGRINVTGLTNSDESGGLDLYVEVKAVNSAIDVRTGNGGATYFWTSAPVENLADGTYSYSANIPVNQNGGAANIFDALTYGWQYVTAIGSTPSVVTARWPCPSCNASNASGTTVNIKGGTVNTADPDEWDESVLLHEYGHVLDNMYAGGFTPDYGSDNAHGFFTRENAVTAYGEGWASFFQSAARSWAGYSGSNLYVDGNWDFDLESDYNFTGSGDVVVEGATAATLYDIFDSANDTGDTLSAGITPVWTAFDAGNSADTIETFWDRWGGGNLPLVAEIYWNHRIYEAVDDASAPSVTITSPTTSSTHSTTASSVSLSGTASDNLKVSQVTCYNAANGASVTATGTTSWACSLSLATGSNAITVTGYDRKNLNGNDTIAVTRNTADTTAPSISVTSPTSGSTWTATSSTLTVGGTASDNVGVTSVTWTNDRGGSGTASGTTSWSAAGITLQSGQNVLTFKAWDAAGNSAADTLTVTYNAADTAAPSVTITSPTSASTHATSSASVSLGGTASDNSGVTSVTWTNDRGGSGTASGTTAWSAANIALQSGQNVLTVRAWDAAGNSATDSLTVTYTPPATAPTVTITSPTTASAYSTSAASISLGGTAADDVAVSTVTWSNDRGGGGTASGTTSWSIANVPLQSGVNVITVTATDGGGLQGSDSLSVTYTPSTSGSDSCASAIAISSASFTHTQSTTGATSDQGDPRGSCDGGSNASTVWYLYTAAASGTLTVTTTGSNYDTVLSAYTGSCGAFTPVQNACNDDFESVQSRTSFNVTAGTTYYLLVSSYYSGGGSLTLNATFSGSGGSLPNLQSVTPSGWSGPIVAANAAGAVVDGTLQQNQTIYVTWAVRNAGPGEVTSRFYADLYVDGVFKQSWYVEPVFAAGSAAAVYDYPIGVLAPGTHTLMVRLDTTSAVTETSESDNEFSRTVTVLGGTPSSVRGDFNSDNKSDLVWQNTSLGTSVVWLMNGTTYAGEATLPSVASAAWSIAGVGDFNNDAKLDLVWRNSSTFQTVVWFLNGSTYAGEATLPGVSSAAWRIASVADFNLDGNPDLLWQNSTTFQTVVWLMNGTTYAGEATLPSVSSAVWSIRGTGDFNNDGKPDLVWRNSSTFQTVVWLMNGTSYAGQATLPGVSSSAWNIEAIADYNSDGKTDLVWRNGTTLQTVAWFLDGTAYVGEGVMPGVSSANWRIVGPK